MKKESEDNSKQKAIAEQARVNPENFNLLYDTLY